MGSKQLAEYRRKRDPRRSGEPRGGSSGEGSRLWVIQKHDASSLHYDLRLSIGGVLVSWAVPKGPSTDPRQRRLAIRTDDHPLDYADFEGVIPEGEYGAGTVLVWDRGRYDNLTEDDDGESVDLGKALDEGHLAVRLHGRKLEGGWALTRTGKTDGKQRWVLVKMKDEHADARRRPTSTEPESVLSGRDLDAVAGAEGGGDEAREEERSS